MEKPKGNRKGEMFGFQLWANLPADSKMMDPRYRGIKKKDIPVITTPEGATVGHEQPRRITNRIPRV